MDAKACGSKSKEKQDIHIVSMYFSQYIYYYKVEDVTFPVEKHGLHHLNQMIKIINITLNSNQPYQHYIIHSPYQCCHSTSHSGMEWLLTYSYLGKAESVAELGSLQQEKEQTSCLLHRNQHIKTLSCFSFETHHFYSRIYIRQHNTAA